MGFNHRKGTCGSSGEFPEYGAIFMSNRTTKQECLRRKLFGLPVAFADFVKSVRSGMILFLFEHERRELYGVFEAVSDGQLDIVPNAYCSSQMYFPSQVRVRAIWSCVPLCEDDFRDAIKDNYFESHKFNFGLSKQQVERLLWLFDSKKIGPEKSLLKNKSYLRPFKCATRTHLKTDDGKTGQENTPSMFSNPSSLTFMTDAGSTSSHHPTAHQSDDLLSLEIEYSTQTACGLGHSSFSGRKQASPPEEFEHLNVDPSCSMALGDYIPLSSSPDHCDIEVRINPKPRAKALYSDTIGEKRSVFSRLSLHLKAAAQEDECNSSAQKSFSRKLTDSDLVPKFVHQNQEKTFEADPSVERLMEDLEQRHVRWGKLCKEGQNELSENEYASVTQRASVFSRLNLDVAGGSKKRRHHLC